MPAKYVVAIDGSDSGWKAMDMAIRLAKADEADLIVAHVVHIEPKPGSFEDWTSIAGVAPGQLSPGLFENQSIGDALIKEAKHRTGGQGLNSITFETLEGNVAGKLVQLLKDSGAEMVFIGSRGRSDLQGLLLGSVSHKVAHLAPCTCVIVR